MWHRLAGMLFAFWLVVAGAVAFPVQAFAADDTFDSLSVNYNVTAEGVVQVQEKWVLRFGPGSGRHGMYRELVTREPFGRSDQDRVYEIENLAVSSPDRVSTMIHVSEVWSARNRAKKIRIGSPDETVNSATATYVINYDIKGALITGEGNRPELYWDVTGPDIGTIRNAVVSTTVPGGVLDTTCNMGKPGSKTPCQTQRFEGGTATFTQNRIPTGSLLTMSVQMNPGSVSNAQPMLVEAGDKLGDNFFVALGLAAATLATLPVVGWLLVRFRRGDDRYAAVPPGMIPSGSESSRVVRNDPTIPIPVSFTPPKLPVAYAGYLLDGKYDAKHLTATIIELAVAGAIRIESKGSTAELIDLQRAATQPAQLVLEKTFASKRSVDLSVATEIADASAALFRHEREAAKLNGWFRKLGGKVGWPMGVGFFWLFGLLPLIFSGILPGQIAFIVALAVMMIGAWIFGLLVARTSKGRRTAVGRAWTDQVEGFRTYIATAEANQLRFEEGEDIFSKYLPWAVLFGLAHRWIQVCKQAIALGQMTAPTGGWYGASWDGDLMISSISTLSHSSSICASSGGSSFSSDGSSAGDGGGGGDAGSW